MYIHHEEGYYLRTVKMLIEAGESFAGKQIKHISGQGLIFKPIHGVSEIHATKM